MVEIRMAHPAKNALSRDLMVWLESELDAAGSEPILLTGDAGAFSAGLNLAELAGFDASDMELFVRSLDALVQRLWKHPAPTVACINGHAIAGGCVLALCCDYRIVADDPRLKLGLNEVALGVCFPPVTFRVVERRVPREHHQRVLLGADLFGVEDALRMGIVDEVASDVEAAARARLAAMVKHPRDAYRRTKELLQLGTDASAEDDRRFAQEELAIWTSDEVRERVRAVLKK